MRELEIEVSEANSNDLDARIAAFDPNDPAALAALERDLMGSGESAEQEGDPATGEESPKPDGQPKQDEKKADEPPADRQAPQAESVAPSGDQVPEGVQAKDGKHVIPYSVLERERSRAARAESALQALAAEIEQLKTGKPAAPAQVQFSEDELAQLDGDLPSVAKAIRAQMAMVESLTNTVSQLQREQSVVVQTQHRAIEDDIEAAIAAIPDLAAWRDAASRESDPDPLMFNRACDLDAVLRNDPVWANRSIAERFAKVVETISALYGGQSVAPKTEPDPADLKKAADAKLASAPAPVPTSLSDIPGGAPPSQSDFETLESASAVALGNRFLSMTPEQQDAMLARIGI